MLIIILLIVIVALVTRLHEVGTELTRVSHENHNLKHFLVKRQNIKKSKERKNV